MAQEQVLGFQISVHHACCPVQVLDSVKHLREVVASKFLGETASLIFLFDEREKVALLNEFQNYEENLNALPRVFDDGFAFAVVINQLDDVGVFDGFEEADFVVEDFLEGGQANALHVMSLDDFYSVELAVALVLRKLDPKQNVG